MSNGAVSAPSKTTFHLAAGLGSGVLSAVLLQPIDLLKTRVQQSGHHSLARALADVRAAATRSSSAGARGRGLGLAALWRGTVPSALRTGFGSALYFASLNAIRQHVAATSSTSPSSSSTREGHGKHSSSLVRLSNTENLLAGGAARALAGFVLMPLTVIKVRYESSLYGYRSVLGAAADIYRAEGARGFFAGFGATAARDAPYAGLYVLFYEWGKRRLSALYGEDGGGVVTMASSRAAGINFASGVLAATACSAVSNPFDAVKTRIQLQPARYRHMAHAARRMLAEEGVRSFFDGLALRMARKALSSALAWTVYEELIRRAETTWDRRAREADEDEGVL